MVPAFFTQPVESREGLINITIRVVLNIDDIVPGDYIITAKDGWEGIFQAPCY